MAGKGRNRELAALAIASGKSISEAATAAGCSERTIHSWQKDAAFLRQVRELRGAMIATAANRLAATMARAAEVLEGLLGSADETERRHAATKIIELGLKTAEQIDLAERIAAIEARLRGEQDGSDRGTTGESGGGAREPPDESDGAGGSAISGGPLPTDD